MVVSLGFVYFFCIAFFNVHSDPQIIIAVVAIVSQAMSYYFGSSTGGAKKDETINNLIDKQK